MSATLTADLKYLALSTKPSSGIDEYPDSGKFGVLGNWLRAPTASRRFRALRGTHASLNYGQGE
jgi:hypothetical protein